ncbi:MAG: hypothetical protein JWP52_3021, partial [Rhizobacter sp.]|nr:hypothetical protein [Rhizobacter sp.]
MTFAMSLPRAPAIVETMCSMPHTPSRLLDLFDPRHSLATGIGWLVLSLSLGFAALAGFWAGDITRAALLQKHNERAINAAEQWSRGLDAAFAQRRQPLRAAAAMVPAALREDDSARLDAVFADLHNAYPELSWIGLARTDGRLVASTLHEASHADVSGQAWFRNGLKGSWLALDQPLPQRAGQPAGVRGLMLAVPVLDAHGHAIGVAGARLDWQWVLGAAQGLQARIPYLADANADALLLDAQGRVLIGPKALLGQTVRAQEPSEDPDPLVTASTTPGGSLQALGWNAA